MKKIYYINLKKGTLLSEASILYEILNGVLLEWDLKKHEIFSNRLDLLIDSSETYLFSIFIEVFLSSKIL
jgi:hypothetical protein